MEKMVPILTCSIVFVSDLNYFALDNAPTKRSLTKEGENDNNFSIANFNVSEVTIIFDIRK